jgi:hypothetical protein
MLAVGSMVMVLSLLYSVGGNGVAPFIGGLLSPFGILTLGQDALGYRPFVLNAGLRFILSVLVVFSGLALCLLDKAARKNVDRTSRSVFLVFSIPYAALLLPGLLMNLSYDRYVLPILPLLTLSALSRFQRLERQGIPGTAWAALLILAAYAVEITHDYSSALRARVEAARIVEQQGIPRSRVSAGLEYDGWTQLLLTGKVGGSRYRAAFEGNDSDRFWFWNFATALTPEYVVTYSRIPSPEGKAVATVAYTAWIPPFRRSVAVLKREDLPKGKVCNSLEPCVLPD